ncbi:MAG: hypothetical protein RQ756_03395, partial [Flavobacteriaceae bacterium]|nr:hypothetical protein [Flavobacteriaceae bacterium]
MRKIIFLVTSLLFTGFVWSQQCNYTLTLEDAFNDGWSAPSAVTVTVDGVPTSYTLQAGQSPLVVTIPVNDQSTLLVDYIEDPAFPGDNTFRLEDSEGILVVDSGFAPTTGNYFTGLAACPTCPAVSNVVITNVTSDGADVDWVTSPSHLSWVIEYGPPGFAPGSGAGTFNVTNPPPFTMSGLNSATDYDIYVQADCGGGDLSTPRGPESFQTLESCPSPSAPNLVATTAFTIDIFWDPQGNTTQDWEIEYGISPHAQGAAGGTVLQVNTPAPFFSIPGLSSNTTYDIYLRADCGPVDGFSFWQGPLTATTLISCFEPSNAIVSNIGTTSADITWSPGLSETEWDLEWGIAGFALGTGTVEVATGTSALTLSNLQDSTVYQFYITAVCDRPNNDFSTTFGPTTFTTQCLEFSTPASESFDAFTANQNVNLGDEQCWSQPDTGNTGFGWRIATGPTITLNTGPDGALSPPNYLFLEPGFAATGAIASMLSPLYDLSTLTTPALKFDYHMFGANMGVLRVDVRNVTAGTPFDENLLVFNGQFQTSGSAPWEFAELSLA